MRSLKAVVVVLFVLFATPAAFAQVRTVGQIVGVVEDPTGAVVPGAEITLVDEAIGLARTTTSGSDGRFVFVDLPNGTFKLSVTMQGFRTAVYPGLKVDVGRITDVTVKLELGAVGEEVVVEAGAQVLQPTSTAIESSVTGRTLRSLPLNNRDVLDFVLLLPGAQQGGTARQSTFMGLPKGSINITMDGINIQDNLLKSSSGGGMFTIIRPKLDAVEEISVTSASAGADAAGEGAIQIKFVTRRGTNDWHGAAFWYHRSEALNANTWFNNAAIPRIKTPRNLLNQYGFNVGGPIKKDKAFFFFNFDDFWLPAAQTRVNTLLTAEAASGVFRYRGTDGVVRTGNLLSIAGAGGLPSSINSTIASMLSTIATARGQGAVSSFDLFRDRLRWDATTSQRRWFPTARVDYHITPKIRWHVVGNWNEFISSPDTLNSMDPSFPGLKGGAGQFSKRWSLATAVNWDLRSNLTYEFRLGTQRSHVKFFPESTAEEQYPAGIRVLWPLGLQSLNVRPGLSGTSRSLPSERDTPAINWGNNLGWVRGKHVLNFGTVLSVYTHWDNSAGGFGIPSVFFGIDAADPAAAAFTSTTLPAIGSTDLTNARALYALLTGRISSISGSRNVDEGSKAYVDRSSLTQRNRQNELGVYFTDSWRARPSLTVNYGLRWEYQGPPYNRNGIYTSPTFEHVWGQSGVGNLFKPGTLAGPAVPVIEQRSKNLYKRSYKNFAPSLGFAWQPRFENRAWKALFGGPGKTVIRSGYSIAYTREGLNHHTTGAGGSPGLTQTITLSPGDPGFTPGALSLGNIPPTSALRSFPTTFAFPTPQSLFTFGSGNFITINPDLKTPYVQSWTAGIQRELSSSMVLEVRYVGNRGTRLWRTFSINEVNIFENGFLTDFRNAQSNLAICRANRVACTGSATGTLRWDNRGLAGQVPVPILTASVSALGPLPALSLTTGFGNATWILDMDRGEAGRLAARIAGSSTFLCRLVGSGLQGCASRTPGLPAGLFPANLFQVNPDGVGLFVGYLGNAAFSTYHGLQVEVRRRMSRGLMLTANYSWSKSLTDLFADSSISNVSFTTLRNAGMNKGPSPWDLRHVFRTYWIYELPFGPGRRWSSGNRIVNKALEGWEFLGVVAIQSGRVFRLTSGRLTVNGADSAVNVKGLTRTQLQKMHRIIKPPGSPTSGTGFVFFADPGLIGADGRSNRSFLDVPTTPGAFGSFVFLNGPKFVKPDLTISKKTKITERVMLEFRTEVFNAFNYQNFLIGGPGAAGIGASIDGTTFGQTSTIFNDLGNQDQGPRMIQFVFRWTF